MQKKSTLLFVLSTLMTTAIGLTSCENNDDVSVKDQYVEFLVSEQQVGEGSGASAVKLKTGEPALQEGTLRISVSFDKGGRFTSDPALSQDGFIIVPVQKGQSDIIIKFYPENNDDVDGDEKVTFSLVEVSDGFTMGGKKQTAVTIFDDEVPLKANFLLNVGSIRENKQEGLDLVVTFTGFAKSAGVLEVGYESDAVYGTDFTTEPAMINGKIVFPVQKDEDYASLRIIPINDNVVTGDLNVRLKLLKATGGITLGDQKTLDITLLDDESYPVTTLASVRGLYRDESMILDNMYVTAVVTSVKDNTGTSTTYIQDETGGIAIRLLFVNDFKRGDQLLLNLGYGLLKETAGVLEIQQVSEADKIGTAQPVYRTMTLPELFASTDDNEGKLITLHDIKFTEANGINTMAGDRIVTDGTRTVTIRTLNHASFKNQLVPEGDIIVRGILTQVNGAFILYPQVFTEDVVPNNSYDWPQ